MSTERPPGRHLLRVRRAPPARPAACYECHVIAVIGEALIDLVSDPGDRDTLRARPGGSPYNTALGLARLGVPTALVARISTDSFGNRLRAHLVENGVSLDYAVAAPEATTLAFALLDAEGTADYEFYVSGTADWQWTPGELPATLPPDVSAVHSGSLALAIEPGASVLDDYLRRVRDSGAVTVSLDPNMRPQLMPDRDSARKRVERQVGHAHLVKASSEDIGWLYPREPLDAVLDRWLALGPALVVATLGANGALALGPGGRRLHVPAPTVRVVDTVGAGDAFTAALLAGLDEQEVLPKLRQGTPEPIDDAVLRPVLKRACSAAAITCTRPGADPPNREELATAGS
jgi:fructokinase